MRIVDPKLQKIEFDSCLRCGAPFPANGVRTLCYNCIDLIPTSGPRCICDGAKLRGGNIRHTIACISFQAEEDSNVVATRDDGFEILKIIPRDK